MPVVGQSVRRVDALGKVTGKTLYPGDINLPNQAHMKILFAGRPHAIVRRMDTAAAEALPGVLAVFTAKDVPVNEYGLILPDQPVLCGPGLVQAVCRPGALCGRPGGAGRGGDRGHRGRGPAADPGGLRGLARGHRPGARPWPRARRCSTRTRAATSSAATASAKAMSSKGFAERRSWSSRSTARRRRSTPTCSRRPASPTSMREGRVTVEVAGQWTHEDQEQIAHALGLPLDQVRVIYPAIGGAFGGREDMSVQIVLALAAWRLHQRGIDRPVKIIWSREESIHRPPQAPPVSSSGLSGGRRSEGKILAAQVEVIADGGRLCLHLHQGAGQRHPDVHRAI